MKFRKKPVVIDAIQWTGNNFDQIRKEFGKAPIVEVKAKQSLIIDTMEGIITASKGDWIIKGVNGEYYPCKPDIFDKTYEKVN